MHSEIVYLIVLLLELVFAFSAAAYICGLVFSSVMGAPYVPSSMKDIDEDLKYAKLKKRQVLVDLGSGDGRIVRLASKKYGVFGIGYDINILLVTQARLFAKFQKLHETLFKHQNIFKADISNADVLYIFLMPELIVKLLPKFESELKKGALVISHGFKIKPWEHKLSHTNLRKHFSTYFYTV